MRHRSRCTAGSIPPGRPCTSGTSQQLVLLRRFQAAGHRPIALAGGATGLIGDPGGKAEERTLLDPEQVAANVEAISVQMARLLDFEPGPNQARMVNNLDWTQSMGAIEFLRDVGKFMTVNTMLAKDSVRSRIERDSGISFTEFSYMLLQANDFRVLYEQGCELQVAGSTNGATSPRASSSSAAASAAPRSGSPHLCCCEPTGPSSESPSRGRCGSTRSSPAPISSSSSSCRWATTMSTASCVASRWSPIGQIAEIVAEHDRSPQRRSAQRRLAAEVTGLVHGTTVIPAVEAATELLFGGDVLAASPDAFALLAGEVPSSALSPPSSRRASTRSSSSSGRAWRSRRGRCAATSAATT